MIATLTLIFVLSVVAAGVSFLDLFVIGEEVQRGRKK